MAVGLSAGVPLAARRAHARLLSFFNWLQQRCVFCRFLKSVALPPRLTGMISSTSTLIGSGYLTVSSMGLPQMPHGVCCASTRWRARLRAWRLKCQGSRQFRPWGTLVGLSDCRPFVGLVGHNVTIREQWVKQDIEWQRHSTKGGDYGREDWRVCCWRWIDWWYTCCNGSPLLIHFHSSKNDCGVLFIRGWHPTLVRARNVYSV